MVKLIFRHHQEQSKTCKAYKKYTVGGSASPAPFFSMWLRILSAVIAECMCLSSRVAAGVLTKLVRFSNS